MICWVYLCGFAVWGSHMCFTLFYWHLLSWIVVLSTAGWTSWWRCVLCGLALDGLVPAAGSLEPTEESDLSWNGCKRSIFGFWAVCGTKQHLKASACEIKLQLRPVDWTRSILLISLCVGLWSFPHVKIVPGVPTFLCRDSLNWILRLCGFSEFVWRLMESVWAGCDGKFSQFSNVSQTETDDSV